MRRSRVSLRDAPTVRAADFRGGCRAAPRAPRRRKRRTRQRGSSALCSLQRGRFALRRDSAPVAGDFDARCTSCSTTVRIAARAARLQRRNLARVDAVDLIPRRFRPTRPGGRGADFIDDCTPGVTRDSWCPVAVARAARILARSCPARRRTAITEQTPAEWLLANRIGQLRPARHGRYRRIPRRPAFTLLLLRRRARGGPSGGPGAGSAACTPSVRSSRQPFPVFTPSPVLPHGLVALPERRALMSRRSDSLPSSPTARASATGNASSSPPPEPKEKPPSHTHPPEPDRTWLGDAVLGTLSEASFRPRRANPQLLNRGRCGGARIRCGLAGVLAPKKNCGCTSLGGLESPAATPRRGTGSVAYREIADVTEDRRSAPREYDGARLLAPTNNLRTAELAASVRSWGGSEKPPPVHGRWRRRPPPHRVPSASR